MKTLYERFFTKLYCFQNSNLPGFKCWLYPLMRRWQPTNLQEFEKKRHCKVQYINCRVLKTVVSKILFQIKFLNLSKILIPKFSSKKLQSRISSKPFNLLGSWNLISIKKYSAFISELFQHFNFFPLNKIYEFVGSHKHNNISTSSHNIMLIRMTQSQQLLLFTRMKFSFIIFIKAQDVVFLIEFCSSSRHNPHRNFFSHSLSIACQHSNL